MRAVWQRLVFHCRTISASTAPCAFRRICCSTHCASYCAPCQPLLRVFSGWTQYPHPTAILASDSHALCRARGEQLTVFRGLLPECQNQNLVLTVLSVPNSLNSGDRLRVCLLNGFLRGTTRAEDAQGTPIQNYTSPIMQEYEDKGTQPCQS